MTVPLIEFINVTKRFGSRTILDRVNLQIYEGDITTIIGKSGAGFHGLSRISVSRVSLSRRRELDPSLRDSVITTSPSGVVWRTALE